MAPLTILNPDEAIMNQQIEPPWTTLDWSKIAKFLQLLSALLDSLKSPSERQLAAVDPQRAAALDWLKLVKALDWLTKNGPELMSKLREFMALFAEEAPTPIPQPTPPAPTPPQPGPAPQP